MSLGRVITAMATPMLSNGDVHYEDAASLARHLANNGSDGIVVAGTTGESPTLSYSEKVELFRTVRQAVPAHVKVIAGTGSNNTADSVKLSVAAEETGVDGLMLVVPYYNKPTTDGLYQHFAEICQAVSLPVMLYNVPGRTAQNMMPETAARLVKAYPNIIAMKEASGDMEQVGELRRLLPEDFSIYSGDDALTLPILSLGGHGVVSVASHLVGNEIQNMIQAFTDGRVAEAANINSHLLPVFQAMFISTNPEPVKTALYVAKLIENETFRLPLTALPEEQKQHIRDVLTTYEKL